MLLDAGADVLAKDKDGNRPFDLTPGAVNGCKPDSSGGSFCPETCAALQAAMEMQQKKGDKAAIMG